MWKHLGIRPRVPCVHCACEQVAIKIIPSAKILATKRAQEAICAEVEAMRVRGGSHRFAVFNSL